jgi:hypothetical protein
MRIASASRISLYHYEGFADYGGDYAAASVGLFGRFALAVSLRRFGWDQIIEDDLGVPTGGLRTGDAQYALALAAAPLPRLQLGVAASRLISENLGVRIAGTSWSVGGLLRYASQGHAGVAVLHVGSATGGVGGERYELPTSLRIGIRQRLPGGLEVVGDGARPIHHPDAWTAHLGLEWRAPAWVVLRAGLESLASPGAVERDARGAAGLGLVVGPLEVSFTTRFGGPAGSQEWFVGLDALRPSNRAR